MVNHVVAAAQLWEIVSLCNINGRQFDVFPLQQQFQFGVLFSPLEVVSYYDNVAAVAAKLFGEVKPYEPCSACDEDFRGAQPPFSSETLYIILPMPNRFHTSQTIASFFAFLFISSGSI